MWIVQYANSRICMVQKYKFTELMIYNISSLMQYLTIFPVEPCDLVKYAVQRNIQLT